MHYLFEPLTLLTLDDDTQFDPALVHELQSNLSDWCMDILNCKYVNLFRASNKRKATPKHRFWFTNVTFGEYIHQDFSEKNVFDLDVKQLENACNAFDTHVIKIIRGDDLMNLKSMLLTTDTRILLLIRDPRALLVSRAGISALRKNMQLAKYLQKADKTALLQNIRNECARHTGFIDFIKTLIPLENALKHRFGVVRYEDMALNPLQMAENIYDLVDLELPAEVSDWVQGNTRKADQLKGYKHSFGTTRDSNATAIEWRFKISQLVVDALQDIPDCSRVMDFFGYMPVRDEKVLRNPSVSLVKQPSAMLRFLVK